MKNLLLLGLLIVLGHSALAQMPEPDTPLPDPPDPMWYQSHHQMWHVENSITMCKSVETMDGEKVDLGCQDFEFKNNLGSVEEPLDLTYTGIKCPVKFTLRNDLVSFQAHCNSHQELSDGYVIPAGCIVTIEVSGFSPATMVHKNCEIHIIKNFHI